MLVFPLLFDERAGIKPSPTRGRGTSQITIHYHIETSIFDFIVRAGTVAPPLPQTNTLISEGRSSISISEDISHDQNEDNIKNDDGQSEEESDLHPFSSRLAGLFRRLELTTVIVE